MEFTGEVAAIAASGPAITAVIAALRQVGVAQKYTPLIAIGIGLALSVIAILLLAAPPITAIGAGVIAGASATGLHQSGRSIRQEVIGDASSPGA